MGPPRAGTKNDSAGKGQRKFTQKVEESALLEAATKQQLVKT
jgi:hypothetical protein